MVTQAIHCERCSASIFDGFAYEHHKDCPYNKAQAQMTTPPTPARSSVDHPSHYTSHPSGVECIDIAQHHNFNVGNAIKHIWRAGLKPVAPGDKATVEDEIRDLEKARKYLEFEIKRLELRLRAVGTP